MYSEIGKFDTFLEHNFIDVSKGDYGEYTALESFADRLLAFKQNLVHVINISSPSVANWYLEDTFKYYGVKYPYSVAKTNKGVAWASDDGCYFYDGKGIKNLIDKKIAVSDASFGSVDWNSWYRGSGTVRDVMLGYDPITNSLIMMRSPNDGSTNSNQCFIYDFDSNGWTYNTNLFTDSSYYTNFVTDMNNNLSLGVFNGSTDVEFKKFLPIQLSQDNQEFYTKDIDFGFPELTKKVYKITVTSKSAPKAKIESSLFNCTSWLNIAVPASLPSRVKKVVSELPSVPLNIISLSPACASIVILPVVVVRFMAASPAVKASPAANFIILAGAPPSFTKISVAIFSYLLVFLGSI